VPALEPDGVELAEAPDGAADFSDEDLSDDFSEEDVSDDDEPAFSEADAPAEELPFLPDSRLSVR
jgi:hypothetical protein